MRKDEKYQYYTYATKVKNRLYPTTLKHDVYLLSIIIYYSTFIFSDLLKVIMQKTEALLAKIHGKLQ